MSGDILRREVTAPGRTEPVRVPCPDPGPGEVVVRITACGVCASDLHPWQEGAGAPLALGHEPVGVVEDLGPGVRGLLVGARVTGLLEPSYATRGLARAEDLVAIPDHVEDAAALGEPLGCLVNAIERTPIPPGSDVAVIGLGFMGLGLLRLLRWRSAGAVIAVDVADEALARAPHHGATETLHPDEVGPSLRCEGRADVANGRGVPVVFEASGTPAGLELATRMVAAHGVLSIVGYHQGGPRQVDVGLWNYKAIDVVNAHVRDRATLREAIRAGVELLASGRLSMAPLVTHRYGLDDLDRAFGDLAAKPPGFVKAVVIP